MCLNARSIINKNNELDIMVDEIKPHIIGITESWANNDIAYAELGLEGCVLFRKDRMGRRGGGVLIYIKDTIPAYQVQLQEEADCNVTGHTTVTVGVVGPISLSQHNQREQRNQSNKGIRYSDILTERTRRLEIKEPLGRSDHNQMHFNINIKSDKTKVKQCRRDFRKGNYKEIRKRLAIIDWNDKI